MIILLAKALRARYFSTLLLMSASREPHTNIKMNAVCETWSLIISECSAAW
jgi:hypothetical protein